MTVNLPDDSELVTTERVGIVVWLLAHGRKMTTAEVAGLTRISHGGAWMMLAKLSRVLPLTQDGDIWSKMD